MINDGQFSFIGFSVYDRLLTDFLILINKSLRQLLLCLSFENERALLEKFSLCEWSSSVAKIGLVKGLRGCAVHCVKGDTNCLPAFYAITQFGKAYEDIATSFYHCLTHYSFGV